MESPYDRMVAVYCTGRTSSWQTVSGYRRNYGKPLPGRVWTPYQLSRHTTETGYGAHPLVTSAGSNIVHIVLLSLCPYWRL